MHTYPELFSPLNLASPYQIIVHLYKYQVTLGPFTHTRFQSIVTFYSTTFAVNKFRLDSITVLLFCDFKGTSLLLKIYKAHTWKIHFLRLA